MTISCRQPSPAAATCPQEQATAPFDAERNRLITGLAYWFPRQGSVSSAILLDYERVDHAGFAPARANERRWGLKTLIHF